jgi:hypothetical protein
MYCDEMGHRWKFLKEDIIYNKFSPYKMSSEECLQCKIVNRYDTEDGEPYFYLSSGDKLPYLDYNLTCNEIIMKYILT